MTSPHPFTATTRDRCRAYDIPVWVVTGRTRPRLFRIRWALRRYSRYDGH